jgi:hypothetical protein
MLSAMHTWSLTAIAVVAGIAMLWVFGRFSNRERAAYAKRQARAQLYAMRLFASEPALILRAQKQLLIWNARYLALLLPPVAIMIIPSILLFTALENLYGKRPIEPGESAIVCARFRDGVDLHELQPALESTLKRQGFIVETAAVRLPDRGEVYWRVRAAGRVSRSVLVSPPGPVRKIEVAYPAAYLNVVGYRINWLVWFVAICLLTMLAASRLGIPALRL